MTTTLSEANEKLVQEQARMETERPDRPWLLCTAVTVCGRNSVARGTGEAAASRQATDTSEATD